MDPSDGGDDSGGGDASSTESSDSADNHIFQGDDVEDDDMYGRAGIGCAGDMFKACKYCGALKLLPFKKPFPSPGEVNIRGMCCNKGSISIDEESPSPGAEFILNLWSSDDKEGKVFRKYSRKINNAFSLASYLATEAYVGNFSPSYKVRGNAYVAVGALFPGRDDLPCFSQMYVYDPDDEVELLELRMNQLELGVDISNEERRILERLMKNIEVNLRACNPYVKQFIMAKDREVPETKRLIFHPEVPTGNHVRTYNAPTHELMVCATDDLQLSYPPLVLKRDTTYCDHNQNIPELQLVHDCHPMYDLIRFLFFFPDGGEGWHPRRKQTCGIKSMTLRQYYKFILHERPIGFRSIGNTILQGHKLMMEFTVMAFIRDQTQKLRWIRNNQKKLRAEEYKTLKKNVQTEFDEGVQHGRSVILPASFYGSPRWYRKKNMESLAIVRNRGKPHLFITMTCNPNHPQILKALPHRASPNNRPDIVLRVFCQQVQQLVYVLQNKLVPGWEGLKGNILVIEFQKRGLPHVHILAILDRTNNITADEIKKYATAEIPSKDDSSEDWKNVVSFMLHRPCGDINPDAPCCNNKYNKCEHGFPKDYMPYSSFDDEDGSPSYRRRTPENGGGSYSVNLTVMKRKLNYEYTSKDVVPHNLWLLRKFKCHINVEICSSLKVIKYLLWYPFKGEARVIASKEDEEANVGDEVKQYEDLRTVGATEAFWRLYEFPLHTRYPKVYSLEIHLEDQQEIYFEDETIMQEIVSNEPRKTQLISFFEFNQEHDGINKQTTYLDFPAKFSYSKEHKFWTLRRYQNPGLKSQCIGCMPMLTPDNGDIFYLRMLLSHDHCKGKKSFIELRTVGCRVYDSFLEACKALGLLDSDDEWKVCLDEAEIESTPARFRRIFATILAFNTPCNVPELIESYADILTQDVTRDLRTYDIGYEAHILIQVSVVLLEMELSEMDFDVSEDRRYGIQNISTGERRTVFDILETLKLAKQGEDSYIKASGNPFSNKTPVVTLQRLCGQVDSLTEEQLLFLNDAEQSLEENKQFFAFVNADAGTGKTFTLNTLIARLIYHHNIQVISAAFSGIASTLLLNGRTFHSQFKAKLKPQTQRGFNIRKKSKLAESIKKTKFIVIDEAPQLHVSYYTDLDEFLQDLMENDHPFGGISVVLAGDFKQTLPIVRKANQLAQIRACIKNSSRIWDLFASNQYYLTKNMRLTSVESVSDIARMQEFLTFMKMLGMGELPPNDKGNIDLPDMMVESDFQSECDMEDAIIDYVYDDINEHIYDVQFLMNNVILCPLNKNVSSINKKVVDMLDLHEYVSYAADTPSDENPEVPVEYLNTLDVPGLPPFKLSLKKHMPIMLMRNINKKQHLCNGTRLIVQKVSNSLLYATNPARNNEQVVLPRIALESDIDRVGILWKRRQFPVCPAFALSMNKSQGQTILGKIGIFLYSQCFAHGQLYVATSRAIHPDHVKYFLKDRDIGARNVVITQII